MKYGQKVTTCPLTLCMTRNLKKGFGRVQNVRSGYLQPECKKKKKITGEISQSHDDKN